MYGIIKNQKLQLVDGIPTLFEMQKVVGGYIETALRVPTNRKNITVNVYVNEEGLLLGLPLNYRRKTDGSYLAGDMVIVGGNEADGSSAGLTADEIGSVFDHLFPLPNPITNYEI